MQAAHPQLFVGDFGDASDDKELEGAFINDLKKAGLYSVPLTLTILIVVFGALVAAGIPLLLALTAVLATFGLWAIPSQVWPSDESLYAMVLLIGLAVGVDYSMFYLKREREERAAGRSPEAALEIAAATSGRSVLISGATVMVAMAGMLFAGEGPSRLRRRDDDRRRGRGDRVADSAPGGALQARRQRRSPPCAVRPPAPRKTARDGSGARSSTASCAVRCSRSRSQVGSSSRIAAPALTCTPPSRASTRTRRSLDVLKTYNRLQEAFPGTEIPANVVVRADDVNSGDVEGRDRRARASARLRRGLMHEPILVDVNERRHGRQHRDPDLRRGQRRDIERRARGAAATTSSRRPSARSRRRGRRRRVRSGVEGLQRRDEVRRRRSCSPSCSGSRSCSCSSRSARS